MHGLDDGVASAGARWGRGGRGRVHGEQHVASVEGVVADRHGVQVLTQQKPQLLVLSAHVVFVFLQSFSLQHSSVDAPHHLLHRHRERSDLNLVIGIRDKTNKVRLKLE